MEAEERQETKETKLQPHSKNNSNSMYDTPHPSKRSVVTSVHGKRLKFSEFHKTWH